MTVRQLVHALLIAGLVSWSAVQTEAQQYNLRALSVGVPTWLTYDYSPTPKINNRGQVVGNRSSGGYLYSGGVVSALPTGFQSLDINNNSTIAMFSWNGDSFLSSPPYSTQTDLGTLLPCANTPYGDNVATGLNDQGVAVGNANANACSEPFFYFKGQMTALASSAGWSHSGWLAINNSNQVVGYTYAYPANRAIQLINGTLTDLDPSNATAYDSEAMAINDAGQFIVNSDEAWCTKRLGPPSFKTITYVCRGTYWYPLLYSGGTITNLGTLGPYGGTAAGINLWGDVVGTSQTSTGAAHAFLYSGGSVTDLNSHTIINVTGWTIQQAYDINDFGQIVALAADGSGNQDVVVLSPGLVTVPPLASLSLNPTSVLGGIVGSNTSTGTVTLSSAAPAGGVIVFLSSSNPVAQVPSMIRVAAGSTTATFTITTTTLVITTNVTISATAGTSMKTATLTVIDVGS